MNKQYTVFKLSYSLIKITKRSKLKVVFVILNVRLELITFLF
jgi:hypothetical protein